jgi:uncharacterized membrane protein YeaQ/YmgE (transglycosylase-associated protein family)
MEKACLVAAPVVALTAGWLAVQIAQSTWPSIFGNLALGSFGAFLGGSVIPLQAASHLGLGVAVLFVNTTIGALALLLPFWMSGSAAEGLEADMLDSDDANETEGVVAVGESTKRWRFADVPSRVLDAALAFHHRSFGFAVEALR